MKPEDVVKLAVLQALKRLGVFHLRINSGKVRVKRGFMHLAPEGTADLLICNPTPLWVELKAPGLRTKKERAEAQAAFRDRVLLLGHRHAVVTSVEELLEVL